MIYHYAGSGLTHPDPTAGLGVLVLQYPCTSYRPGTPFRSFTIQFGFSFKKMLGIYQCELLYVVY